MESIKQIEYWFWASDGGRYLNGELDIVEIILSEFICWKERDKKIKKESIEIIEKGIKKESRFKGVHKGDVLEALFRHNVILDFDFAKSFNLYDIVYVDCFVAENELGEKMIELFRDCGFVFLVSKKNYHHTNHIELHFEVSYESNLHECHEAMITGKIYKKDRIRNKKRKAESSERCVFNTTLQGTTLEGNPNHYNSTHKGGSNE